MIKLRQRKKPFKIDQFTCSDGTQFEAETPVAFAESWEVAMASACTPLENGLLAISSARCVLEIVPTSKSAPATQPSLIAPRSFSFSTDDHPDAHIWPLALTSLAWHPLKPYLAAAVECHAITISVDTKSHQPTHEKCRNLPARITALAWTPCGNCLGYALGDGSVGRLNKDLTFEGEPIYLPGQVVIRMFWVNEKAAVLLTAQHQLRTWQEIGGKWTLSGPNNQRWHALSALGLFRKTNGKKRRYFAAIDNYGSLYRGWIDEDASDAKVNLLPGPADLSELNGHKKDHGWRIGYLDTSQSGSSHQVLGSGILGVGTRGGWLNDVAEVQFRVAYGLLISYKFFGNPEGTAIVKQISNRLETDGVLIWVDSSAPSVTAPRGWSAPLMDALLQVAGALVLYNEKGWGKTHEQEAYFLGNRWNWLDETEECLDLLCYPIGLSVSDIPVAKKGDDVGFDLMLIPTTKYGVSKPIFERFPDGGVVIVEGELGQAGDMSSCRFLQKNVYNP